MMKERGFTLVELMITLAIAAILTTIAIPSFNNTIKNNRLATKTNLLVASLGMARSEAVKRGQTVNVCVSNDQATCTGGTNWAQGWIIWVDADRSGGLSNGDLLNTVEALPTSITFTSAGGVSQVSYSAQGAATTTGIFTMCDDRSGESGRTISMGNTGQTTVTYPTCS